MKLEGTWFKMEQGKKRAIKAHCAKLGVNLSEWLAKAAVAMYENENETAINLKGESNEKQQTEKSERHV
jgi:hypothetical protein